MDQALDHGAQRVASAIARALAFLEAGQLPDGAFQVMASTDPNMAEGCSADPSVFPTALIAHSLGFAPAAAKLRERAHDFLLGEMDEHRLWRHWTRDHPYFRQLPPDLDDSSCASATLVRAGRAAGTDPALMLANRDSRGLFYTWVAPRLRWSGVAHLRVALPQLRHAPTFYYFFKSTSAAPGDVDAVVNANCLHYLGAFAGSDKVVAMLVDVLRAGTETTCDKWYKNPFAIWYFFSRALSPVAPEAEPLLRKRLASARPATALETALAAASLLCWGPLADEELIDRLLSEQGEDGSWPRAALYFGGRERRRDGSLASAHPDTPHWGSEALTTALCVEALSRWLGTRRG